MNKQKQPKPFMLADVRDAFFPHCCAENRGDGRNENRPILKAFRQGRIIGVPTRWRMIKGRAYPIDFKITREEWRRLHAEGINAPIDEESEVAV